MNDQRTCGSTGAEVTTLSAPGFSSPNHSIDEYATKAIATLPRCIASHPAKTSCEPYLAYVSVRDATEIATPDVNSWRSSRACPQAKCGSNSNIWLDRNAQTTKSPNESRVRNSLL